MKTHAREWVGLQNGNRFLFCSKGDGVAAQLGQALGDMGMLTQEVPGVEEPVSYTHLTLPTKA